jgi:hypothetical protein
MPTQTYTPLANVTLAATASSITFGSIPATYRDLVVVLVGANTQTDQVRMILNGSTTSSQWLRMTGTGSAATSVSGSQNYVSASVAIVPTSTLAIQITANIIDYSATDKHKTVLSRVGQTANGTEAVVSRWPNTAAVTSVALSTTTGVWQIGTTAAIYGVIA